MDVISMKVRRWPGCPAHKGGKTGESPALARNGNLSRTGSPNTRLHRVHEHPLVEQGAMREDTFSRLSPRRFRRFFHFLHQYATSSGLVSSESRFFDSPGS